MVSLSPPDGGIPRVKVLRLDAASACTIGAGRADAASSLSVALAERGPGTGRDARVPDGAREGSLLASEKRGHVPLSASAAPPVDSPPGRPRSNRALRQGRSSPLVRGVNPHLGGTAGRTEPGRDSLRGEGRVDGPVLSAPTRPAERGAA